MNYSLEKLKLSLKIQIQILLIQLRILILRQKLTIPSIKKPKFIIIHHEGASNGFDIVNAWHKKCWGFKSSLSKSGIIDGEIYHPHSYIGYQLYLDKDKKWHRGRSDFEEGAHCPGHNKDSIGICVIGNHKYKKINVELNFMLINKVDELRIKYDIPKENVLGDKEGRIKSRPTSCPCLLMEWVKNYRLSI